MDKISSICLTLAGLYGISVVLSYLQGFIMATVTQKTTKELRSDISNKMNKLPLKYFDKTTVGDVLSRMTNDVDTIGQTLNQSIGTLVSAISLLLGSLYMMTTTNITLTITAVVSTIIGFRINDVNNNQNSTKTYFSKSTTLSWRNKWTYRRSLYWS